MSDVQDSIIPQYNATEIRKIENKRANTAGQIYEEMIQNLLFKLGFIKIDKLNQRVSGHKQFFYNRVFGKTIYGGDRRPDFVIWGIPEYPDGLVVEIRYQGVGGTADHKYPYLYLTITESNKNSSVIVIAGNGASKRSSGWIKSKVGGFLVGVFEFDEFNKWLLRV